MASQPQSRPPSLNEIDAFIREQVREPLAAFLNGDANAPLPDFMTLAQHASAQWQQWGYDLADPPADDPDCLENHEVRAYFLIHACTAQRVLRKYHSNLRPFQYDAVTDYVFDRLCEIKRRQPDYLPDGLNANIFDQRILDFCNHIENTRRTPWPEYNDEAGDRQQVQFTSRSIPPPEEEVDIDDFIVAFDRHLLDRGGPEAGPRLVAVARLYPLLKGSFRQICLELNAREQEKPSDTPVQWTETRVRQYWEKVCFHGIRFIEQQGLAGDFRIDPAMWSKVVRETQSRGGPLPSDEHVVKPPRKLKRPRRTKE